MLVRTSRDGDQFHYLWAARRCLRLLSPSSGLVAVTIEGPSTSEFLDGAAVEAGEELIDVGEYYGSQNVAQASLIRYIQLKHSTLHPNDLWPPSGLQRTIGKFAQRYMAIRERLGSSIPVGKLEFWFVSNRPVGNEFLETIEDAAGSATTRHPSQRKKLEEFTGLNGSELASFCMLLRMEGGQGGYSEQRNLLFQDIRGYLPEADIDGPIQLKELVTQKALSQNAADPSIIKMDVLRALKTDEAGLFPAPCLIEPVLGVVPREQEPELMDRIVNAAAQPVLLHAAAGVGKTVFSARIQALLPQGSVCILYDCFGNGEYRSPSRYRHRHKTGLVQVANELASKGLCDPLIPAASADSSAYLGAFLHRLEQAIASIRAETPGGLLCIVIDAADNAQIAAEEINEARSFVRDLIREEIPEGIRLVAVCRTERQDSLDPPPKVVRLELRSFSWEETASHLRGHFPGATKQDVNEFHSLSSQNPRVQAMALSRDEPLEEVLRRLGPNPTTVEMAIEGLLNEAIGRLRDSAGSTERRQIDDICTGLAILRPLIPMSILASMSGVSEAAIRSFAVDLGRPLHLAGETIQFFDEPAETWFRERFKAKPSDLTAFLERLKPLALSNPYVASVLPQLMLEAGQFPELVDMALSSKGLPETSRIERRDVELQRLQFAFKASLRMERHTDAAKLALKAAAESAGQGRESALLQTNTDLAAKFLDTDRIQEIVSRRTFGSGWVGSQNAYEAGIMSGKIELIGEARSRLRMAAEWLRNWSQLSEVQRREEHITVQDIAELAMAQFQVHGPAACAQSLRNWRPRQTSFLAGKIIAQRLVDHARYSDLDELACAAGNDVYFVLAIAFELGKVHRSPPFDAVKRAVRLMGIPRAQLVEPDKWMLDETVLAAVVALVEAAHRLSASSPNISAQILTRYLPSSPPPSLSSEVGGFRHTLLRAYTLRAALRNEALSLNDLAYPELRQKIESKLHSDSQRVNEFREAIGALLPWHRLWAEVLLGRTVSGSISGAIADAESSSAKSRGISYRQDRRIDNEIAQIRFDCLVGATAADAASIQELNEWIDSREQPLFTPTLTHLARLAARSESLRQYALAYANRAFRLMIGEREDAQTKADVCIDLARAVLPASPSEARAYFDEAVEVAGKVGDENLDRWTALLDLADRSGDSGRPVPETAYRLGRCAEVTYEYVARDKYFNWLGTVRAIAGLCPSSSLAILSRWRDRDFGRATKLLPEAVMFLIKRGDLDGRSALPLLAFQADWEPVELLRFALAECSNQAGREAAVRFAIRYMTLSDHGSPTWRALKDLLTSHNLVSPSIAELAAFSERTERPANTASPTIGSAASSASNDWDMVFEGADLITANGVSLAYDRFRSGSPPLYADVFFAEACRRVPVGREAEFIRTLPEVKRITLFELRQFLEHFPGGWREQLSVKHALIDTLKSYSRAFCMEISVDRYYELFPFEAASDLCGFTKAEVAERVLSAVGQSTEPLYAKRLFSLVGLLALRLSQKEALNALIFGLDLFEEVLEEKDGDGPWSARLAPPTDVDDALAGYVWAGLAAPRARLRWEATHAVRGLCTLGREKPLEYLFFLAKAGGGGPFADSRLHFYAMHAKQWLLIALARAAKDHPRIIGPHADFLIDVALYSAPHVLIRGFAARTVLELLMSGVLHENAELERRLVNVNVSPFPVVVSDYRDRARPRNIAPEKEGEGDPLYFGIDTGDEWFAPLGKCFGLSEKDVERAAKRVITVDWQYTGTNRWGDDERHKRKIFDDFETWESRSDPGTHDLQFYQSYHAVMVVAGELLAKYPTHHDSKDDWYNFDRWLKRTGLSRGDGGWVADRRDSPPLEWPLWKDEKASTDWKWSICRDDFDKLLILPDKRVNIWGDWTLVSNSKEESVSIRSALVSPATSEALLRAQQSTDSFWSPFPTVDDANLEIDEPAFKFKGWIAEWHSTSGLDERDPWAGDISYPPRLPGQSVVDFIGMSSDSEHREWVLSDDPEARVALWSQIWGQYREKKDDEGRESGSRLQASLCFISEFLKRTQMNLIVKVQIRRLLRGSRHGGDEDDEFKYPEPSGRFFLFKRDGGVFTI